MPGMTFLPASTTQPIEPEQPIQPAEPIETPRPEQPEQPQQPGPVQQGQQEVVGVAQRVTVEQIPSRSDLATGEENWTWPELRDYVCSQILAIHGPFPRDSKKEYGIFNRFLKAHGQDGIRVAKAAFEIYDGWWAGAPISINRFTKGSDPYFVAPILSRLNDR